MTRIGDSLARSMSRISQQQAPQSVPAPHAFATAETLFAPFSMVFRTSRSVTRLHTQTIIFASPLFTLDIDTYYQQEDKPNFMQSVDTGLFTDTESPLRLYGVRPNSIVCA